MSPSFKFARKSIQSSSLSGNNSRRRAKAIVGKSSIELPQFPKRKSSSGSPWISKIGSGCGGEGKNGNLNENCRASNDELRE
mmetsp:Transcript_5566/g.6723  ORF Transcript_5566/g.6723 Transcript_5566/m.6723 type:complete len:82 (-) Transcript_5566:14-259(-)